MEENKKYITNFYDLDVYQRLSKLSKIVIQKVIPKLPPEEKFDLCDQASRASKAACAIIAEGFAKRFQQRYWQKYLTDAIGECYEMINHLFFIRDLYYKQVIPSSAQVLIDQYEICVKQLHALSKSWRNYHKNK